MPTDLNPAGDYDDCRDSFARTAFSFGFKIGTISGKLAPPIRFRWYIPLMTSALFALTMVFVGQSNPDLEPAHQRNRIYYELLNPASKLGDASAHLPPPILRDGLGGDDQQAAILKVAGSERHRAELLRDSVTAPFVLKIHDTPTDNAILRRVDLWFVVRGDIDKLDPLRLAGQSSGQVVDVGNMRFESRLLKPDDLKAQGASTTDEQDVSNWFVFVKGRLLGRTGFKATDEVMASRGAESMVVAARSSTAFAPSSPFSNRWWAISNGEAGPDKPFAGGLCYAKVSRLKEPSQALLVEMHSIFSEPRDWFRGEPILRSKFSLIAQDQIRRLRRELASNRSKTSP